VCTRFRNGPDDDLEWFYDVMANVAPERPGDGRK